MPKFRSVQGGHVKIIRQDSPSVPIDIDEGGTFETDDKDQVRALRESPEVEEVKAERSSKDSDKD